MKILTKQQEQEHYYATLRGGTIGGVAGLALGGLGVVAASNRYHFFRNLTLPLKAFLITSSGTFAGIVAADHSSRAFEQERNPIDREFKERERQNREAEVAGKTFTQRAMDWGKKERYKIVGVSWIASMATAFSLVNRNKYLTGAQKLVQARVYAQFLTLGVLVASAAFEISDSRNEEGRWETVRYIDPHDPDHKRMLEKRVQKEGYSNPGDSNPNDPSNMWKDMVAAEEQRIKDREEQEAHLKKQHEKKTGGTKQASKSSGGDGGATKKDEPKEKDKAKPNDLKKADDKKEEENDESKDDESDDESEQKDQKKEGDKNRKGGDKKESKSGDADKKEKDQGKKEKDKKDSKK